MLKEIKESIFKRNGNLTTSGNRSEQEYARELYAVCEDFKPGVFEWISPNKLLFARKSYDAWLVRRVYLEDPDCYFLYLYATYQQRLRVGSIFVGGHNEMQAVGFDVRRLCAPELVDFTKSKDLFTLTNFSRLVEEIRGLSRD